MHPSAQQQRRLDSLAQGKPLLNVRCHVGFALLQGSYQVKTKMGTKPKRKTTNLQVSVRIGGIRSGLRSTGVSIPDPETFERETLTIAGDSLGSARLQAMRAAIMLAFQQRLLGQRSLNPSLILDIGLGLATHDDEQHYTMGKTSSGRLIRDKTVSPPRPTIAQAIGHYLTLKEQLLGNGLVLASLQRYQQYGATLTLFLTQAYGAGAGLDELSPAVEHQLLAYLKGQRHYAHNYAIKILQFLKSLLTYAHAHGWVDRNVLGAMRLRKQHKSVRTLSMAELERLGGIHFAETSLNQVRDVFLFCCYTGLAYTDVASLSKAHIVEVEGVDCILKERNKSGVRSFVPLFPEAIALLKQYADHPLCQARGVLLPVLANAKMNQALKIIGNVAGIGQALHTHLARKSFTQFVEKRGFNLEHMAVMLGHTRTSMTEQHYHQKRQGPVLSVFKSLHTETPIVRLAS